MTGELLIRTFFQNYGGPEWPHRRWHLSRSERTLPDLPLGILYGARWRQDDHLCLVAGIMKVQIAQCNRHDVATTAALAQLPLPFTWKPECSSRYSYERSRRAGSECRLRVARQDAPSMSRCLQWPVSDFPACQLHRPATFSLTWRRLVGTLQAV